MQQQRRSVGCQATMTVQWVGRARAAARRGPDSAAGTRIDAEDAPPHLKACLIEVTMERAVPILPVDDLRRAREYYVDKLGFTTTFEASEDGHTGLLGIARGSIVITLDCPMDGHGRNVCVALEVADADACFSEWGGKVPVRRSPHNEAWGARTFDLEDPFGNTIFVMGPIVAAK